MDSKTSAPETVSQLSGYSSAPLSYDDDKRKIYNSVKNYDMGIDNKDQISSSSSSSSSAGSDGGSEHGGFVSGEEEFERALEKPFMADADGETLEKAAEGETLEKAAEGDDADAPFVDSSEFPMADSGLPIENVSANTEVEGDSKVPILNVEETFGHGDEGLRGILDEVLVKRLEIEGVDSVEKEGLGNVRSRENVNSGQFVVPEKLEGLEEPKGEPSGVVDTEAEGVKFNDQGDSVVDAISVDALQSGAAVVGDVERVKDNGIKELEVPVDGIVKLENGFDLINRNVEEPMELKSVKEEIEPEKRSELETNVGTTAVQGGERKFYVSSVAKDDNANIDTVTTENEGKEITMIKPESDFEAKQTETEVGRAADVAEHLSNALVDGGYGVNTQAADYVTESIGTDVTYKAERLENDQILPSGNSEKFEGGMSSKSIMNDSAEMKHIIYGNSNDQVSMGAEDEENHHQEEEYEIEGSGTDGETDGMVFGSSEAAQKFLEELERASGVGSHSGAESSRDNSQRIDGQIVTDSDEADTDEEGEGKELFDSAALAALLKAATGADTDSGSITITSQDGSKLFSVERPAGLGTSLRTLKPGPRPARTSLFTPSTTNGGETQANLSEEDKMKLETLQQLRVKFLRLVHRLAHSPEDSIAAQVLYRLSLVAGRPTSQLFDLDAAKRTALQLEEEGKDDLNFSLNILVMGKTGVGKSATINSIFGEEKTSIHAFEPGTTSVKEIVGTVDGVKIRVIDTPGLKSSGMEQGANRKVLSSIKKFTKKFPPDIVLYVDRLDSQTRDLNDLPLLRSISNSLGSSIWRSAIVTLTHAASAPPDGPSGSPLSYEVFVAQRSHVVQQSIGQAVGDLRLMNPSLMNPVSLVENHPACRKNRDGQKVLPNGQTWRPQLLLLCYSMKILSEASSLSKSQDPFDHRKLFGFRVRSPPLPYLLSWLLQSRTHPKLSNDQSGDNGDSDIDLADLSDSDQEEDEDEYDQLPPFKPLRKAQIAKLSKEQRKAYFEEYDYRVKLLQKKQWREELRRMKEMKKKGKVAADDYADAGDDVDQENGSPAAVPVPLPDMVLPPSFDSDNPAYRYRFLEPTSQFLARPVLDTHGWDHDCGYDGVNIEQSLAIAGQFPAAVTVQVTKDKKEFNIHLDSSISAKHGEDASSMAGFDIQNVGKQLAYILRGETKFKNFKKNKTAAGFSVTFLGENVATGVKLEDQIALGKRIMLVGSTGTVRSQGDSAYGANLEVRLREADYPIGQDQSSLGLSLVKWRGDLALGANLQSQFSVGRSSKIAIRAGLNNKLSGQITVRTSTSDQLQIALMGIVPIFMTIYKSIRPGARDNYSTY